MSPDHDERDDEYLEDDAPRSIFSATWFRVVLVVLALGVVGAVAIPYVRDVVQAPPTTTASTTSPPGSDSAGARAVTTPAEPAKPVSPTAVPSTPPPTAATPKPAAPPAAEKPADPKPAASAKATETAKPAASVKAMEPPSRPQPAERARLPEPAKPVERARQPERPPATRPAVAAAPDGEYFVQVGAFKDEAVAKRAAARLRESNYPVIESVKRTAGSAPAEPARPAPARAPAAAPGDRYDVLVSGGAASEINTKLAAKGLASEPSGDGVRIRPSLPLRDAVALSKDLGSEGFKVQVRRGGTGGTGEPVAPAVSVSSNGALVHRVRVGGYADRAAAQTVLRELREKGYDGFIAKGRD